MLKASCKVGLCIQLPSIQTRQRGEVKSECSEHIKVALW